MVGWGIFAFTEGEGALRSYVRNRGTVLAALVCVVALGLCAAVLRTAWTQLPVAATGWVDGIVIDQTARKATISGWVGSVQPGVRLMSVSVSVAEEEIYDGAVEAWERPDVVDQLNKPEWLNSGWRIIAWLPDSLKTGRYPIKVRAQLEDGRELELANVETFKEINIP
jgi:hypothetical protein